MKSTQFYKNTSSVFSALAVSLAGSPAVQAEGSEQSLTFSTAHLAEFNSEITVYSSPEDYTFPSTLAMHNAQAGETSPSTLFDDPREDDEDEDDDQQYSLASLQGSQQPVTAYSGTRSIPMSVFSSSGTGSITITDESLDSYKAAVHYSVTTSGTVGVRYSGSSDTNKPTLNSLSGSINASTTSGSVTGLAVNNATVKSIDGTVITVSGLNSVVGINVGAGGTVGASMLMPDGETALVAGEVTMKVTAVQGSSFIRTGSTSNMGLVWGDFTMITNNTSTNSWDLLNTFSVGYILGYDKLASSSAVGFQYAPNAGANRFTSDGFLIDWNNTKMAIARNLGLAAGAAVISREGGYDLETIALLKNIKFGTESTFNVSVNDGMAAGTWLNGVDTSEGKLLGTIHSSALKGSSVGLLTVGTDDLTAGLVTQSADNTQLGHVSGTITSTVYEATAEGKSIGLQLGNVGIEDGKMVVTFSTSIKELSGDISAAMYKDAAEGSPEGTVAGIIDVGVEGSDVKVLNFNADANGTTDETGDEAGTSVTALYYERVEVEGVTVKPKAENPSKVLGLGHAILTLKGGITVNSVGETDGNGLAKNTITFVGNLTAGSTGAETITFKSGKYNVTSDTWAGGAGITLGTNVTTADGLYEIAQVNLMDLEVNGGDSVGKSTAIVAETLNFTANNSQSVSQIHVGDENALHLSGLVEVNIYLTGDESSYDSTVYFVDARNSSIFTTNGEVYDSVVAESTGETKYKYNIYFEGSKTAHTQHDGFKVVHDGTGIYLQVPEPSTATLSLLALTSLMARRRRRHV